MRVTESFASRTALRSGPRALTIAVVALGVLAFVPAAQAGSQVPPADPHTAAPAPSAASGNPAAHTATPPLEHTAPAEDGTPQPAGGHAADAGAHAAPAEGHHAGGDHGAPGGEHGSEHGESPWVTASRLANFAILAGGLWYLLRKPAASYLEARGEDIRGGLTTAASMKATATKQLAEIQSKMAALPGELAALKARGTAEIAAEQERIRQQAEGERRRILDQAHRDMDLQVQAATRDLTRQAATLAVGVAERRIAATITDEDQHRLMAQYVTQLAGTQAQAGATHE